MTGGNSGGIASGTPGTQRSIEQENLEIRTRENEKRVKEEIENEKHPPTYDPSPKHSRGGPGTPNPIKTAKEGQKLLDTGYHDGKQIYNVTERGEIVVFQPDNTPNNGYHSYEVTSPKNIPNSVLKQMLKDGKISNSDYKKIRTNNWR